MNAFIVLSTILAVGQAGLIASPYNLGLQYANTPLAYANQVPLAYAQAPVVAAPIPAAAVSSQFQAQDEFGNVNYGYSNVNSAKTEVGNAHSGVTGSYSYVDAYGIQQRVDYIADDLGFRVRATNLPVAPVHHQAGLPVAPVYTGVAPSPVVDTPEVQAAKAEFFARFEEEASRSKRSTPAATAPLVLAHPAPLAYNTLPLAYNNLNLGYNNLGYNLGYNNLAYNGAIAAPVAAYNGAIAAPVAAYNTPIAAPVATVASAPAAREAILTKVKLNPGHALFYRVD